MVKNSFISVISISQEEKKGSVEFQIFSFTNKIRRLTSHLELHRKDYLSRRGLRQILGKRQRLLSYLYLISFSLNEISITARVSLYILQI